MKNLEIGIAKMSYDETGKITEASFTPTMKIDLEPKVLIQLSTLHGSKDVENIQNNAGMVLASWFSKTNDIELADRDHFEIASETVKCDKYSNGHIKHCEIRFIFKELVI